jgi:hypothetical protein
MTVFHPHKQMKTERRKFMDAVTLAWRLPLLALTIIAALALSPSVNAFPPAPHHLFMGMVRDEYGNPLLAEGAEVILDTLNGRNVRAKVKPGLAAGVNYRLAVPMDSGITQDAYQPTALAPTLPFTIRVRVGNVTYLPLELAGDFGRMGEAGATTRLNLTLGVDSDGDGLPDAWELALIAALEGLNNLADVRPGDDSDGDGLSNLNEYLVGSYAFDKNDGFELTIKRFDEGRPVLEFLAIHGRTYTVRGSADLRTWEDVEMRIVGKDRAFKSFLAEDVKNLEVEPAAEPGASPLRFFKLLVQ